MSGQKSFVEKSETVHSQWFLVDGTNQVVGRLATRIARVLQGKHKASYTPHVDDGDFVVVINADKVRFTGPFMAHDTHPSYTSKLHNKRYVRFTGFPSGYRVETGGSLISRKPDKILREAVRRMLPKNKLGFKMLKKLRLFAGSEHPHAAQNPQPMPQHLMPKG